MILIVTLLLACGGPLASDGSPSSTEPGASPCVGEDLDLDGVDTCSDCDDGDDAVFPGATEACDGVDRDCDGQPDTDPAGVGLCEASVVVSGGIDVLVVVDNSCSMGARQGELADQSGLLMDGLLDSGVDFHLGVVTTDANDLGMLKGTAEAPYIDRLTPDPAAAFERMVMQGIVGSGEESGRDQVIAAVEAGELSTGRNAGFIREHADLAVVFVTDENDYSSVGFGSFAAWSLGLKAEPAVVTYHAIASPGGYCPIEESTDYIALAALSGGTQISICLDDWSPVLQAIPESYAPAPYTGVPLPVAPLLSSLAATVIQPDGTTIAYSASELTWDAVGQQVTLPEVPTAHSEVLVFYAEAL